MAFDKCLPYGDPRLRLSLYHLSLMIKGLGNILLRTNPHCIIMCVLMEFPNSMSHFDGALQLPTSLQTHYLIWSLEVSSTCHGYLYFSMWTNRHREDKWPAWNHREDVERKSKFFFFLFFYYVTICEKCYSIVRPFVFYCQIYGKKMLLILIQLYGF